MSDIAPVTQSRVFVLCPTGLVSGGPELLHQLVGELVEAGRDASIVYTPLGQEWDTPAEYLRYRCPVARTVPDTPDTAVIVPEVSTALLFPFQQARHVVWWLSADNYRGSLGAPGGWKTMLRRLVFSDIPAPRRATHFFQSAYAREYVRRHFGVEGFMLSDYLASEYLAEPQSGVKRNAVAYNPRKGYRYTARLIDACPEFEFVRLEGMTRQEMRQALDNCRVYVDFGIHPGKDRVPREAAARGAVVLVGRQGAANLREDVNLDDKYKFPAGISSIGAVKKMIASVFRDYEAHYAMQAPFRADIANEHSRFKAQVREVFGPAARQRSMKAGP